MNIIFLLTAVTVVFMGCTGLPANSNIDRALIGEWACESATVDGKTLPEATVQALRLTLTDSRWISTKGEDTLFDSVYRVNRSTQPHQIFMLGNEGTLTGKEAQGIYKLRDDKLHICYAMPGDARPEKFESVPGSKAYLTVWRRLSAK